MQAQADQAALVVRDLTVTFGGLVAVDRIAFDVREGEVLSLIGPNGAGKTTAFNAITGYLRPSAGEISYRGARLNRLRPNEIAEFGVGIAQIVVRLRIARVNVQRFNVLILGILDPALLPVNARQVVVRSCARRPVGDRVAPERLRIEPDAALPPGQRTEHDARRAFFSTSRADIKRQGR